MQLPFDTSSVRRVAEMVGEDQSETAQLRDMLDKAEAYLRSFKWCPPIAQKFFGYGIGGVIAVFLFKLAAKTGGTDEWLWVVEGDVPSAYLVTDKASNPQAALTVYCELMEAWAHTVLGGGPLNDVFPVRADPTPENASMLLSRTRFIRERLIPVSLGPGMRGTSGPASPPSVDDTLI